MALLYLKLYPLISDGTGSSGWMHLRDGKETEKGLRGQGTEQKVDPILRKFQKGDRALLPRKRYQRAKMTKHNEKDKIVPFDPFG